MAETVEKYVHKGDKLYVEGKIRTRSYDDQKGIKRYVTEIYVENMEMLSPRSVAQTSRQQPSQATLVPDLQSQMPAGQEADSADDLPF